MTLPVSFAFSYIKRTLLFRFEAGTSRGVMHTREIFWIKVHRKGDLDQVGWGEAAPLAGLSPDFLHDFEQVLIALLAQANQRAWDLEEESLLQQVKALVPFSLPAIRFSLETALLDFLHGGRKRILTNSFFDQGIPIPINGLIWMGTKEFMLQQINKKLEEGFACLKMKIGAIDFDQELELFRYIREQEHANDHVLRVDANGAFSSREALGKLEQLQVFGMHSIEQPIAVGQWKAMRELAIKSPIPIALDEELIGKLDKEEVLNSILPQYLILKPSLLGGILETREWIQLAEKMGIGWWMTSALESAIGLNAISQLTSTYLPILPQGLGTGKLYHNNLESPLLVSKGEITYQHNEIWEVPM
ncbi:MAG: o-succinylbenzoate synthase [Bacteroidetes bacterium]|nr:o-succinylbenzoate synthase [Bacteroidota bacterium]